MRPRGDLRSFNMWTARALLLATASAQRPPSDPLRFSLWQRGDHTPCDPTDTFCDAAKVAYLRQSPILAMRGGADGCSAAMGVCDPSSNMGPRRAARARRFSAALDNDADHAKDCDTSYEHFFCASGRPARSSHRK